MPVLVLWAVPAIIVIGGGTYWLMHLHGANNVAAKQLAASSRGRDRRGAVKRWTEEDYKRLKQLIGEGASAFRAAAAMKRPVSAVRSRARKLGLSFPSIRERRQKLTGKTKDPDRHMRHL